jgi:phage major head subunit gpT-like protein
MAVSVTPELVTGALTTFRTIFNEAFDAASNLQPWRGIAMEVQSTGETETHHWLGTVPSMIDVTHDTLQVENLYAFDYSITNNTYKAAFEVPRSFFEDEKLGLVTPKIRQLAEEAARHPGQLIFQQVVTNPLAFDGVAFIADTRTIGASANIDNQIAGTGTSVAQFQTDLAAATAQMMLFQDDRGRPMSGIGNVIMVPPALRQVAYQALNTNQAAALNQMVAPPTGVIGSNEGFQIVVNPYLTDTNDWYLLRVSGGFAPFIYQTRVAPTLEPLVEGSANAILNDTFVYTVRARYNCGVGDPRHIVKTTNT